MKNVLLANLSTFPYDNEKKEYRALTTNQFVYQSDGEEITVEGLYQLDPIPNLLKKRNIDLDVAILLTTNEVKGEKNIVADDYMEDKPISELAYFTGHLQNLMNEESRENIFPIDIDENAPEDAIKESVKKIQELSTDDIIHIYVDTHGGFRTTQLLEEAIVQLIQNENIEKTFYSVQFGSDKKLIIEDTTVKIFDFVSGINEFINYGRIDSLLRYVDGKENDQLLQFITEISEGIQWCDISDFSEGLKHLKNYFRDKKSENTNPYVQIFEEEIKKDYEELIEDLINTREINASVMIEWCMRKGFYQQSLTILESRMADEIFNKGVMVLTDAGREFKEKYRVYPDETCLSYTDILNGCLHCFKADIWRFLNKKLFNKIFSGDDTFSERYKNIQKHIEDIYLCGSTAEELLESAKKCSIKTYDGQNPQEIIIDFAQKRNSRYNNRLFIFLFLHKLMKKIRNQSNHASENGYDKEATKNAIDFYLELFKKLV